MAVVSCIEDVSGHAALLLATLNLQRERAQFCDCVVRQKQSPAQLYPAHRCILAASSPVLESVLSSAGALVELQASCLSGSVLALLLDFIYTGDLPCTCTQEQYCSLLDAARYLQMEKLERALCAVQHTAANETDNTNTFTENQSQSMENTSKTADASTTCLPLACSTGGILNQTDECSLQKRAGSSKVNNMETTADAQMHSSHADPYPVDACGSRVTTGAKRRRSREDAHTMNPANTNSESESSGNEESGRQVSQMTLQNQTQNISSTTEGYSVSRVHKDMQKYPFHPAGTIKESWQNNTDEEMEGTDEGTRSSSGPPSSSTSSSSPHPCCGAVPVICHSSRASMFQLVQVSAAPSYRPVPLTSANPSRATSSRSASTENEMIVGKIYTEEKKHYELEDLDHRNCENQTGTDDSFDQCESQNLCYSCIKDQSDRPTEKSISSKTKEAKQSKHVGSDDLPTEAQQADWSDSRGVSAADDDLPPGRDSDTGNDSYHRHLCPRREPKEENVSCGKSPAEMQKPDLHFNHCGPEADWYSRLQRAETSTDVFCDQQESHDPPVEDRRHSADVCLPLSNTPESSLESATCGHVDCHRSTSLDAEKVSDAETSETLFAFTIPVDNVMSDPVFGAMGQSYHGHVRYHCIPQDDVHLSHGGSGFKHSHPPYHDHSNQSSEEEDVFLSPGHSPLGRHFTTGTSDQVLLLDISTKHSELLVSYKHRADQEKQAMTFDSEQRSDATSVAGAETSKIRAVTKLGLESFDQVNKSRFRETNDKERKSAGAQQSRSRAQVKNRAGDAEEASKHEEGENQSSTLRVCSAPSVPESAQTSLSSTLSVCIPSSLPASMSTSISAPLSAPVHHAFQCSLCDRSFSQRGSLNRHVRSHLGVRPFPCPRCPMTFSRQYRVTEHMRVHQRCTLENDFLHPSASSM